MIEKKRPMYRRFIAAAAAIVLIGLIALITNSFTGNPISAHFAQKHLEKYVNDKYPNMKLNFSKAEYNFKFSGYTLKASMPGSPDTHFMVTRRSDGHIFDDYEAYVLGGYNTIDRLGKEMTQEIEPLLKHLFGTELSGRCFADCISSKKDLIKNAPPLDTPYSRDMKLEAAIYIDFDIKNPTLEDIADKLQRANELLGKEGFSIGGYIVEALNPDTKKGYAVQVEVGMINENLLEVMENALDSKTYDEKLYVRSMK